MIRIFLLAAALAAADVLAAESWTITAAEWSRPRSGEVVAAIPGLASAVRALDAQPDSRLLVRHPGGEEGALWAAELRDWLVALGVPADRIEWVPGGVPPDRIELDIEGRE